MGKDLESIEIRGKVNVESIFQTFKVWNGPNWGGSRLWKGSWFFCVKFKHLGIEQQRQARRRQQTLFWDVWTSKPVLAPGSGTAPGQQPRVPGPPILSARLLYSYAFLLFYFSTFILFRFSTFLCFYFSVFLLFCFSTSLLLSSEFGGPNPTFQLLCLILYYVVLITIMMTMVIMVVRTVIMIIKMMIVTVMVILTIMMLVVMLVTLVVLVVRLQQHHHYLD